ncbi:MAG TPA: hypothetical protein ACHBX0_09250 [Arsenophonus sp.]
MNHLYEQLTVLKLNALLDALKNQIAQPNQLDYHSSRGIEKTLIRSLSQGSWLNLKQNLLLTGA